MLHSFIFLPILSLTLSAASNALILHEKRDAAPAGFSLSSPASADTMLHLRMALKQSDPTGLEQALHDVSTPSSPLYGKHLTSEEVASYTKPSADSFDAVVSWLKNKQLPFSAASHAGDWLQFSISVEKANEYFGADFSVFTHDETGSELVRTLEYSVPAELKSHIKILHPTLSFSPPNAIPQITASRRRHLAGRQSPPPSNCSIFESPSCLQAKYNIPTEAATQPSNALTVTGFQFNYPSTFLIQSFLNFMRPDAAINVTFGTRFAGGATNTTSQGNSEVSLDMEYTMGIATGVPVTFLAIGLPNATIADFPSLLLDGFGMLLKDTNPPQVVSTSYGADESFFTPAIAESVCNLFMQLGARGVSLLFSSGDGGVQASTNTVGDNDVTCKAFGPTFPSGCPYVTSIGATRNIPEIAAQLSSGGFSNIFPAPSYQTADTAAYVTQLGSTYQGLYNATGRGFPDVSAAGLNFNIRDFRFGWQTDSGTSASTPVFASIIALINDRLIAAGKSPMGFLNPFLYSAAGRAALNDITTGSNPGCNTTGFAAVEGWDPVTGLGTPDFPKLLAAAMAVSA
ncbi:family S53 protease [Mycena vulgaris]|nr:family S53 protease [Mycena vulgaris]